MEIEFEPRFLDEAVLRLASARPEGRLFYRERESIYRIADTEKRGRAFDALTAAWSERLGLVRSFADALAEQPLVVAGVARCAVGRPPSRRDAGAELLVRPTRGGEQPPAARLLRLLLAPEMLLAPDALRVFLQRELQHVSDMLDPHFAYEPRLPAVAGGPGHEALLRERYRGVWDVSVDGRLMRSGRLPSRVREERRDEFLRTFAALGGSADLAFNDFFTEPAPTHATIVEFVTASFGAAARAPTACALCGAPTADPESDPSLLPADVREWIRADFPAWRPVDGCCRQCADLYRARPLSLAGAAGIPGIR
jgi:hypothetical protein